MYGYEPGRTRVADFPDLRPPFKQLWERDTSLIEFPPVAANGKLFVAEARGHFYAADGATGKIVWQHQFKRCSAGSPAYADGVVYHAYMGPRCKRVPGAKGLVVAMDAETGAVKWRANTEVIESSLLYVKGSLYFGGWDGQIVSLDAATGKKQWSYAADSGVTSSVAYHDGTLFVGSDAGSFYALDASSGRLRWKSGSFSKFGKREYFYATPSVAYGRVYAPNTDGYVYSFGEKTGKLRWARRVGTYVYSAPAIWKKKVYVGTYDGFLVAMDAATGDVKWKYAAPAAVHGAAIDRGRRRLLLDAQGPALRLGPVRQERPGPHVRAGRDQRQGHLAARRRAVHADHRRRPARLLHGLRSPLRARAEGMKVERAALVLGALGTLVALSVAELGSDPTPWKVGPARSHGVLGPLVRAADGVWDPGLLRAIAVLGGVVVVLALIAVLFVRDRQWRCGIVVAASIAVVCALLVPATLLQIGLRDGTAPWFHTNDSVYQIEIAGDLVLDGTNPYGRDYSGTGMERIYDLDGTPPDPARQIVALGHFPYFPGMALFGAGARLLPSPFDDMRFAVLLCTLALLPAAMLLRGPFPVRLAIGAVLAANPLAVRAAWFGTADAPALLALVLAFACAQRRRFTGALALVGVAMILKQFAALAAPFLLLDAWRVGGRQAIVRPLLALALVIFVPVAAVRARRPGRVLGRHHHVRRRDVPRDRVRPRGHPRECRRHRPDRAATRSR